MLLDTTDAADRLEAFASDGEPDRLALESGAPRPLLLTIGLLAALFVYAVVTRSRRLRVVVDEQDKSLTVRGGEPARYDIDAIESVSVEERGRGRRVVLRLRSGETRPLTDEFSKGHHHQELAAKLAAALAVSTG